MKHEESRLQTVCLKGFKLLFPKYCYAYTDEKGKYHAYCMLVKNCNEGSKTDIKRMIEYKEGLTPGMADMSLKIPSGKYHGLEIEFKTDKGKQTEAQKAWQVQCEKYGYRYVIVRSWDDFARETNAYLYCAGQL